MYVYLRIFIKCTEVLYINEMFKSLVSLFRSYENFDVNNLTED